jgi:hypothetical protein
MKTAWIARAILNAPIALLPVLFRRQRDIALLERTLVEAMRRGKRTHARKIRAQINKLAGWPLVQRS